VKANREGGVRPSVRMLISATAVRFSASFDVWLGLNYKSSDEFNFDPCESSMTLYIKLGT